MARQLPGPAPTDPLNPIPHVGAVCLRPFQGWSGSNCRNRLCQAHIGGPRFSQGWWAGGGAGGAGLQRLSLQVRSVGLAAQPHHLLGPASPSLLPSSFTRLVLWEGYREHSQTTRCPQGFQVQQEPEPHAALEISQGRGEQRTRDFRVLCF